MKSYDLIVIGAGIAGMTAAIGAANKGIKNILLIEREEFVGGPVSYTHLTLPTKYNSCRSRWSPYH